MLKSCPACFAPNPPDTRFCTSCSVSMAAPQPLPSQRTLCYGTRVRVINVHSAYRGRLGNITQCRSDGRYQVSGVEFIAVFERHELVQACDDLPPFVSLAEQVNYATQWGDE